ncbi:hypothetical protein L6164_009718 [Bauhinia variegata]|uniref:Uncharacterized protein n=1 Tax=Bauhinia variegata TaxID=167791 RepID=A0ACB9PJP1_BAUVA|nr:hypothetical protein L6164_009718 [Bauhinia variegata]
MAKKRRTPEKKKSAKIIPIDYIPKYSHQPRSSAPKRRTDFSVFTHSPSKSESSPDSSSVEVGLLNDAASSLHGRIEVKHFAEGKIVQCSNSEEDRSGFSSKSSDAPISEVESVLRDEGPDYGSRDACEGRNDTVMESESTLHESPVTDSNGLAISPGSVVWAKRASQMWWPAEIMKEGSTLSDQASDGHILVQFYGNHPSGWIDPTTDVSSFEDSFKERSGNPSKDFQDALKQALKRKQQFDCGRKSTSVHSNRQDHSADKGTSSASSRAKDDPEERRRGNRERKRKVHFDETIHPVKSKKEDRRLKIMRYLGLAAPIGSPF